MKPFRYTCRNNSVNTLIEEHMKKIVSAILKKITPVAILLGGGFSRGEGPVKVKGKKIFPLNDYDIYVITKKPLNQKVKEALENETSNIMGYKGISVLKDFKKQEQIAEKNFYVDIKFFTIKELKSLLPRLKNYELKTVKVLYGKDVRKSMNSINLKDIPLSEAVKLLLDRMSQLSYYYSTGKYDKENLSYFIQQAYAACQTSLLLLSKKYNVGYYKNMQTLTKTYEKDFPELAEKCPGLDKRIKKFIEWRLKPDKLPENIEAEWFKCREDIYEVTKYVVSNFLNKQIEDIDDLSESILKMAPAYYLPYLEKKFGRIAILSIMPLNFYFKLRYFLAMKRKKPSLFFNLYSPDIIIFSAVPYVLFGVEKDKKDNLERISKAKKLLNSIYFIKSKNWEDLSLEYCDAYFTFYLQKFA